MSTTYWMRFGSGDPRTLTGLNPTFLFFIDINGQTLAPPSIAETYVGTGIYKFTWGTTSPIAFLADAATTSPGAQGRYVAGTLDPADRIDQVGSTLIAYGLTSIALGTTNVALGTTNVALGTTNVALGTTNVAIGTSNIALGTSNVALGTTNVALGTTNVALGTTAVAAIQGVAASFSIVSTAIGTTASSYGTTVYPVDVFGYLKRLTENLEGDQTFYKASGVLDIYARGTSTLLREKTVANSVSLVTKT